MSVETSIIIRTFNEEEHLEQLFRTIARQSYSDFETIVVDSGSYDRTLSIAERYADHIVQIDSYDFTFGYSLNTGIRNASGEYIAIVSAHTIPLSDRWLKSLISPLSGDAVAMTYGRQVGVQSSKFGEAEDLRRSFGAEPLEESFGRWVVNNANSSIKKNLWTEHKFDESLTGLEDIEWARYWMRRGKKVLYVPSAGLHHIHEESWSQIRNRYYREAVAARRMGITRKRSIPKILARETKVIVEDWLSAVFSQRNPVRSRLSVSQCLREILYFRLHKNIGTLKGLIQSRPIETPAEQEELFFNHGNTAVVIQRKGEASLEYSRLPPLAPGEVLIRVAHVAVCATDLEVYEGTLGYYKSGLASYPIVPGHEFSGKIAATGLNVNGFLKDEAVVVEPIQSCGRCDQCTSLNFLGCDKRSEVGVLNKNGAYANFIITHAKFVHKLPPKFDLRAAALCEPAAVVLKGLRRLNQICGTQNVLSLKCLVIGLGPLGHLCAKILDLYGYDVSGYDHNADRRAFLEGTNVAAVEDAMDIRQFDVIVEATGNKDALEHAITSSKTGATLLLLGLPYGRKQFTFEEIAAFDKTVIGSVGSTTQDFIKAVEILPKIDLSPYFQCSYPLTRYRDAWRESRNSRNLKVILDIDDADLVANLQKPSSIISRRQV